MKTAGVTGERAIYLAYRREGFTRREATELLAIQPSHVTILRWERWFQMEQVSVILGR